MAKKELIQFFTTLGGKQLVDDIKAAEKLRGRYDHHYRVKRRSPSSWNSPGDVHQVIPFERGLRLECEHGWVELRWIAPDCLRVRLRTQDGDFIEPFSYAVNKVDWPIVPIEFAEGENALEMRSAELICRIGKRPFRLGMATLDGHFVCMDSFGMQVRSDGAVRLGMMLQPDETCYGLGLRATNLQLRGKRFSLWNSDSSGSKRDTDPLTYSVPFYLGVHAAGTYGIFWDNSVRGAADLGAAKAGELVFEAEGGELRYFLFVGPDVKRVLARYTELTGHLQLPPLWGLGYHQARFSYYPEDAVLKLAWEFRSRGIPCDALYLDIHLMDGFRLFTWSKERFPHFQQMINTLHEQGFKVVVNLNPGVKTDPAYPVYASGIKRDVFLKTPDERPFTGALWSGLCHYPDFSNPAARSWWAELVSILTQAGVDGICCDMSEPVTFTQDGSATLPDYVLHDQDGLHGTHLDNHNVYGSLMARATREGLEKHRSTLRQFNLIRAGYAGAQRYAGSWISNHVSDWEGLRLSVSMALNMGLSGSPLTGPDVGGFLKDASGELLTRWIQAACLMPFFRSHSSFDSHAQEPWSFGQPYEVINRVTLTLRYRLLPYLYSVIAQAREYGWPIIRPLFMAEPDNPHIRAIDDCYLVGDALLVAPVLEAGAVRRAVYLPAGEWYDYWTNELLEGGEYLDVPAPLERLPLFVKAGSVLPLWPEMQYTNQLPIETLVYRAYPGHSETVLYEDGGDGLDYEKGDYRWIYMTCGWDESRLVINRRVAGRYQPSYKHIKLEVVGLGEEPQQIRVDRQSAPLWFFDDDLLELVIDSFQSIEIRRKPLPTDATIVRRPW